VPAVYGCPARHADGAQIMDRTRVAARARPRRRQPTATTKEIGEARRPWRADKDDECDSWTSSEREENQRRIRKHLGGNINLFAEIRQPCTAAPANMMRKRAVTPSQGDGASTDSDTDPPNANARE
jgi:hypothetical protein